MAPLAPRPSTSPAPTSPATPVSLSISTAPCAFHRNNAVDNNVGLLMRFSRSSYKVPGPAVYSSGLTKVAGSDCTGCEATCKVGSGPSPTVSAGPQPTGGSGDPGTGNGCAASKSRLFLESASRQVPLTHFRRAVGAVRWTELCGLHLLRLRLQVRRSLAAVLFSVPVSTHRSHIASWTARSEVGSYGGHCQSNQTANCCLQGDRLSHLSRITVSEQTSMYILNSYLCAETSWQRPVW